MTLSQGDRVIFSSRTIPGNEKAVGRVINGLIDQGVEVITDRTHLVHVSGHPRRPSWRSMYRLGEAAASSSRCTARRCICPSTRRWRAGSACRKS